MADNILLVRTDRIGDVVLVTPAISVLRENFPGARISFLASPYAAGVVRSNPALSEVLEDRPFLELVGELRRRRFDAAVIFFVNFKVVMATLLAGIPLRIGPASKLWSVFLSRMIRQKRSTVDRHEADFNIDLVLELGGKRVEARTGMTVSPENAAFAEEFLVRKFGKNAGNRLVILHPGSRGSAKDWPPENFAALGEGIKRRHPDFNLLLTGGQAERGMITGLAAGMKCGPAVLDEDVSVEKLAAIIAKASLLAANSTGPLHIATAVGVPTISFFPPLKNMSPSRWGPYGPGHTALMPSKTPCQACPSPECGRLDCMTGISVSEAEEAAEKLLSPK